MGYFTIAWTILFVYSIMCPYKEAVNLEPGKTYTFHTDGTYEVKITSETK